MENDIKKNVAISKVFTTEWFTIDAIHSFVDKTPYYALSCNDSVSILAITNDGKIILVRQYRPPVKDFTFELPSGYVDENEAPANAIKRELKEETGFICDSIHPLGTLKICPSRIDNTLHIFFGKNASVIQKKSKEDDSIEIVLITQEEFKKMISEGKYIESAGIAMYFIAQLKGYL